MRNYALIIYSAVGVLQRYFVTKLLVTEYHYFFKISLPLLVTPLPNIILKLKVTVLW